MKHHQKNWIVAGIVTLVMAMPALALAQSVPPPPTGPVADPAETAKVRMGPLFLQPQFGLKNVGLDNNVFNTPEDPQRDWTATINMGMLAGLRFGPTRFTVTTSTDYVWFAKYRSERSIDGDTRYQFEVRTPRFRPWVAFQTIKTHERAGFELDARAGSVRPSYEVGLETKVGFRLGVRMVARHRKTEYDDEEFRGVALKDTLDATWQEGAVQLLYELSPLSNLRLSTEISQSSFETATKRDSRDLSVYLGLEGKRDAGLEGHLDVGWKQRIPEDPTAPTFSGVVARAAAAFILWEQVRVAFGVDRDVPWSYDDAYTFYVHEGVSTTVTWRPWQRLDFVATGKHYWLHYDEGLDERAVLRVDKVYSYGGGFGFFISGYPGTRLGLTVERAVRDSILPDRRYDSIRYYTNVGFSF